MRITITCPSCAKRSQIESQHRGRRLKCPYPDCRKAFIVGDDGQARSAEEAASAPVPQVVDWQSMAPPAGRQPVGAPEVMESANWEPPPVRRGAEEPSWEPPPVRRGVETAEEVVEVPAEDVVVTEAVEEIAEEPVDYSYAPVRKKKSRRYMVVGITVGLLFCGIAGGIVYWNILKGEERAEKQARKDYDEGHFAQAAKNYQTMQTVYSSSKNLPRYKSMGDLSDIRALAKSPSSNFMELNPRALAFFDEHKGKPFHKDMHDDIWEALADLTDTTAGEAKRQSDPRLFDFAQKTFALVQSEGATVKERAKVGQKITELTGKMEAASKAVAMANARREILDSIAKVQAERRLTGIPEVQSAFDNYAKIHPDLVKDTEIKAKLDQLKQEEPTWVSYVAGGGQMPRGAPPDYDKGANLWVCPPMKASAGEKKESNSVTVALDRGVVYGLDSVTGDVRWAMRVGIDTQTLPARVRASPTQPELALVSSAETNTLYAVDTQTGKIQWHYPLGHPSPAGPILIGRPPIAYLPTADGTVHVIEPLNGRLIGRFVTGQPLTVPGTFDPVAQRLYIPAAQNRIYVFDTAEKRCDGVIYTGHALGGLRGSPAVGSSIPIPGQSILVIAEATGLDVMKIRPFLVPANVAEAKPVPARDGKPLEFTVRGWSWFAPYFDGDTLGIATDRGYLALFGLARGTRDDPLFRIAREDLPIMEPGPNTIASPPPVGRAQIAKMDLGQWWLLSGGKLHQHRFDLYRRQLVRNNPESLPLGLPLQEGQSLNAGQNLLLVSQAMDGNQGLDRTLATTLDADTGKLLWQRQLGFVTAQEPVVVGDQLFVVDKLGGFLRIDTKQLLSQPATGWQNAGEWLANGVDEASVAQVVAAPDNSAVIGMVYGSGSEKLFIRRYDMNKGLQPEVTYRLDSAPAGTPILTEHSLIVPCKDGNLREFPLTFTRELPLPITWRGREVGGQALGHAVLTAPDQLYVSDGARSLQHWTRDASKVWQKDPSFLLEVPARISTPIALITVDGERCFCLGDQTGTIHLWSVSRLAPIRSWNLGGRITEGPFIRDKRLGCVVENQHLVWLDPNVDQALWKYSPQGEMGAVGAIIGEPQLVGNRVLVAEASGQFVWLDAESGGVQGRARSSSLVVPATGPAPVGTERAIVFLTDGTILQLTPSTGD